MSPASSTPTERESALKALQTGAINVLFSVDVFNEGLDIPLVDTILLLRSTESHVVLTQLIDRGLRRTDDKDGLAIRDIMVRQHQRLARYAQRLRARTGLTGRRLQDEVDAGFPDLPAGCALTLDREAQQLIMENLRTATRGRRRALVDQLVALGTAI